MKKALKILSIVVLSMAMIFAFSTPVSMAAKGDTDTTGTTAVFENLKNKRGNTIDAESGIYDVAGKVIDWIWVISLIVSIVVVMVIGVKFIIGGTQEKAKYKESLIPVVVGIILVVFATTLVKFLFSIGANG